jgi:hypothetical protein
MHVIEGYRSSLDLVTTLSFHASSRYWGLSFYERGQLYIWFHVQQWDDTVARQQPKALLTKIAN